MADIVDRLGDDSIGLGLDGLTLRAEAADEIERLREALGSLYEQSHQSRVSNTEQGQIALDMARAALNLEAA